MTFPQRAASLHCDAWPHPLGPQLALQQSSRGRQKRKGVGHGSRGKREQRNRTKNSICSGLDGSFFSLESSALNPICASCQLCPVSLVGTEKKLQMADKLIVHEVRTWLTLVGMAFFWSLTRTSIW